MVNWNITEARYGVSGWSDRAIEAVRQMALEGLADIKILDGVVIVRTDSFPGFFNRMSAILNEPLATPEPRVAISA